MAVATMSRQIHHTWITEKDRWIADPDLGMVKRREQVMKRSDVLTITKDDQVYERQPDGTFWVPDKLAEELTRQPHWHYGENPFPPDEYTPTPAEIAKPDRMAAAHAAARVKREQAKVTRTE